MTDSSTTMAPPLVIAATLTSLLVLTSCGRGANTEASDKLAERNILVDTKIWLGSTELGERSNWRNWQMPCTLLERIQLNEKAVVSMGDALDYLESALESNGIKELGLERDGVLLLEEDTLGDADPQYVEFLHKVGQCFDSDLGAQDEPLFVFEPASDSMSWFNPANWRSRLLGEAGGLLAELAPDSHRIPCSEDVVVLGSRSLSTANITLAGGERAQTLSFKVNFRPSQAELAKSKSGGRAQLAPITNVRVSKLRLGEHFYEQPQLDHLLRSPEYENLLFQFKGDPASLLVGAGSLVVDSSSVAPNSELCLDEAGCFCANEQTQVMGAICSFSERLQPGELPCLDPISSAGYCDKICASVLTISMEPSKFSEHFLVSLLNSLANQLDPTLTEGLYVASRRTGITRFEMTFRPAPLAANGWQAWSAGANERHFARLVHNKLNSGK